MIMHFLHQRLQRLEREHGTQPQPCPSCGAGGSARPVFTVSFGESDIPDHCPRCGRRQVYRIEFDQRG
jgi:predicted RNA-binding Zn-ribbon protein involved in translation (DUF1610 family)